MSVSPRVTGKLTITVHEGKELTDKDMGKQDPYAKLILGKDKQKTKTHKKGGTKPRWDQTFLFTIPDYDLKEKLTLEIWDEDTLSDDKIGRAYIGLDELVEKANNEDGFWFQVVEFDDKRKIAGYIRISVKVEGKGWPEAKKAETTTDKKETATTTTTTTAPTPTVVTPTVVTAPTTTPIYVLPQQGVYYPPQQQPGYYYPPPPQGYAQQIGRAVQQECRDRSRMPSSA
eukprot:TRINITY_DN558_c0_g1_i6.p1 TRINITY_DN558_c0_g1~~TRINITY_DN558_c0_g1_i6.p1  ORF type:complete len:229 (-),score=40.74 TRINITY_DN558_c0_g1_i6:18-704(-)